MQGFKAASNNTGIDAGPGLIKNEFPNKVFPVAAVHEFISLGAEDAAATIVFVGGLLSPLIIKMAQLIGLG